MDTTARTTFPSTSGNSEKGDGALHKAALGAHAAVDKIADAADEAVRKVKPAIDRVADLAHRAVGKAADAASPTAEWLSEQGEGLMATPKKLADSTYKYVAANPLKSLGIALVAGLLVGRLIR